MTTYKACIKSIILNLFIHSRSILPTVNTEENPNGHPLNVPVLYIMQRLHPIVLDVATVFHSLTFRLFLWGNTRNKRLRVLLWLRMFLSSKQLDKLPMIRNYWFLCVFLDLMRYLREAKDIDITVIFLWFFSRRPFMDTFFNVFKCMERMFPDCVISSASDLNIHIRLKIKKCNNVVSLKYNPFCSEMIWNWSEQCYWYYISLFRNRNMKNHKNFNKIEGARCLHQKIL